VSGVPGSVARVTGPGDVPPEILDRLRPICLALPETYEEPAWTGVRWRIRQRTFAHVCWIDPAEKRSYALAAPGDEPMVVMTFRAPGDEFGGLIAGGPPFYHAGWGTDVVGVVLDEDSDWAEIAELLTDSYCVLAPKRLVAQVSGPPDAGRG
jgi:hypothetical protein